MDWWSWHSGHRRNSLPFDQVNFQALTSLKAWPLLTTAYEETKAMWRNQSPALPCRSMCSPTVPLKRQIWANSTCISREEQCVHYKQPLEPTFPKSTLPAENWAPQETTRLQDCGKHQASFPYQGLFPPRLIAPLCLAEEQCKHWSWKPVPTAAFRSGCYSEQAARWVFSCWLESSHHTLKPPKGHFQANLHWT